MGISSPRSSTTESQWNSPDLSAEKNQFDEKIAREASEWFVLLMAGDASTSDHENFQKWLNLNPRHKEAWEHIERINTRVQSIPSSIALRTLAAPVSRSRRRNLQAFALLLGIGGTGFFTYHQLAGRSADYQTATGETQTIDLDDGSQLVLNTSTSVDIHFSPKERIIQLHTGEIVITTGHRRRVNGDAEQRPFIVTTQDGYVRALGTKFSVHRQDESSSVSIFEGAVEITPDAQNLMGKVFHAGEAVSFDQKNISLTEMAHENTIAWTKGLIIADGRPLSDFTSELNRYRPGYLRCHPAVSNLRVSGVFKLSDIDGILSSLVDALPVRIRHFTPFWTSIDPA